MTRILIALVTFLVAFAVSLLLDINLIARSWPRYGLVLLLMLGVLTLGWYIIKVLTPNDKQDKN